MEKLQSNLPSTQNDKQELVGKNSDEYLEFFNDFEKKLEDLKNALQQSNKAKELAQKLQEKSVWESFVGNVNGKNTKELAEMIENLGLSLGVTQEILKLMMKVQNAKNSYIREFHKALVDKIANIEKDTDTLDTNQRLAAVSIISGLRDQVEAQIEQQAMVENHQKKLQMLDDFVEQKHAKDWQQDEKIESIESRAMEIIRVDEQQQALIEELQASHASKEELDRLQTKRIDTLMTTVAELEMENEKRQRSIDLLETQNELIIKQLQALETANANLNSLQTVLLRNLLPATAFIFGLSALFVNFW